MHDARAYCGILCQECPAYLATIHDDEPLRESTAKKWGEMLHTSLKPEEIDCLGCQVPQQLFSYCKGCQIFKGNTRSAQSKPSVVGAFLESFFLFAL